MTMSKIRLRKSLFTKRKHSKKYFSIGLILFVASYFFTSFFAEYLKNEIVPDILNSWQLMTPDDISCYDKFDNDSLKLTENTHYVHNAIYFHQTSCSTLLNLRQACSIESAARSHPKKQVNVLFTGRIPERCYSGIMAEIFKLPNVVLSRINLETYVQGTALEKFFEDGFKYKNRRYRIVAEYLKYLTLYKYGGIVLDLDVIVTWPFDMLGYNWVVRDAEGSIGSAVIAASTNEVGRKVIELILSLLEKDNSYEEINGGEVVTKAFKELCPDIDLENMEVQNCSNFHIFGDQYFYPIKQSSWSLYFESGEIQDVSYGYHFWNSKSSRKTIPKDSLLAMLARAHCPGVFSKYSYDFVET